MGFAIRHLRIIDTINNVILGLIRTIKKMDNVRLAVNYHNKAALQTA